MSGRYRVKETIGSGSQATVYCAVDELLGREVALKVFRHEPGDARQARRQAEEVRILAGVSHHALVTLFDAGVDLTDPENSRGYFVMELIRGTDLQMRAMNGPMLPTHMALLGHDLADGLSYIHHRGIIHRDIKPANILLASDEEQDRHPRAKLSDFGIAMLLSDESQIGQAGTSGTPAYLSPEQALGEEVGPPSDVYSLGLVLLEGLTGIVAYPGAPLEAALARLLREPQIPSDLAPKWAELLTAMLSREPGDRPTARDVSLSLRQEIISSAARRRAAEPLRSKDEEGRMQAVHRYRILDTPRDGAFDRITALAARLFSVPVSIVSVVDHDRIWFKSHHGTSADQVGRDPGLCASAILQSDPWVVTDASTDLRALANPLVAGEAGFKAYAGIPLQTPDGYNLGTLCILDHQPRQFSAEDIRTLEDLAAIVMNDLEMRLQSRHMFSANSDIDLS